MYPFPIVLQESSMREDKIFELNCLALTKCKFLDATADAYSSIVCAVKRTCDNIVNEKYIYYRKIYFASRTVLHYNYIIYNLILYL